MNEMERDSYLEKLTRKWILYIIGIVSLGMLLLVLYANIFHVTKEPVAKNQIEGISAEDELRKFRFASDYDSIEDMAFDEKKEDLAKDYVIGQDMLVVSMTIPDKEVRDAFVEWTMAIQNTQESFSLKRGGAVVGLWSKYAKLLEDEELYSNLYAEIISRSTLIRDSINDIQWDSSNKKYYDSFFSALLAYERSGDTRYLDEMEETIQNKPDTFVGYDIQDEWLAKINSLRDSAPYYKKEYEEEVEEASQS